MSESKELNSPKAKTGGWKLFLAEVVIGLGVLIVWSPIAAAMGIASPLVSIIFAIAWVIFWMTPVGHRATAKLNRLIHGG